MSLLKRGSSLHKSKPVIKSTSKSSEGVNSARNPLVAIHLNESPTLNLSISDCTCPICLEILVEPVVLPCKHELCLPCFSGMTDKTNFLCPMCRMRISTWSRTATNTNTLVNTERWNQIKKAFPNEVKDRIEGKSAEKLAKSIEQENAKPAKPLNVAKPGEIRKEYETILQREMERLRAEKEQEEKMSLQYIQQVIASEERLTVNEYVSRINSNTPQMADANLSAPVTRNQAAHTPVIAQSSQPASAVPVIPLRQRLHQVSGLPNTPVNQRSQEQLPEASSIGVAEEDSEPAVRRICTRSSIKRNIEDVKNIRAHLLTSIAESKSISEVVEMPRRKLRNQNRSDVSLISNESQNSISENLEDDTLHSTRGATTIKRRGSLRLKAKQEAANESTEVAKTPTLVRRESHRLKRPRKSTAV